jgi:hypothetical protein
MKTVMPSTGAMCLALLSLIVAVVSPASAQTNPGVTIVATDPWAAEALSDPGVFTVRRTGIITSFPLRVFYQISGTASNGVDYEQVPNSVEIPAGALEASFSIKPIDDSLVEMTESVLLRLMPSPMLCPTCGYVIGDRNVAEVLIQDNDPRDGTNDPPVVRLNEPQNGDVFRLPTNIALRAYAQDTEDHFGLQVEFLDGTNSLGFGTFVATTCPAPYCPFFQLIWSNAPPGEHVLRARVTDSHGATTVSDAATIYVIGAVNIYATDPDASEIHSAPNIDPPSNPAIFTVRRSGEANEDIVVFYEISGTASNGVDYQRLPGYVSLPRGVSSAQIIVQPIDDNLAEGIETVVLTLQPTCPQCLFVNPPCLPAALILETNCFAIGPDYRAVAYIRDGETTNSPPSVRIALPEPGATFIAPADVLLVAVAVDPEDGKEIKVEFFEGTNSLGFGTFNPTRCAEIWCGNFVLGWSNVPPGSYYLRAEATDSQGAVSVSAPVQIIVLGGVNIYATDPTATERPATTTIPPDTATFTVRRSGDTSLGIVVFYEITGTASNGVDYRTLSGYVGIPQGASSAEIVVDPVDDTLSEPTETVRLRLLPTCPQCLFTWPPCLPPQGTNCYPIGPQDTAVAFIRDNDPSIETNHPPFVELIAPREDETFVAPADIRLVAFTQDEEDKYNSQVEFFEGTRSLGFGTFNPTRCWPGCPNYVLGWSNVPPGRYTLTAQATDSAGATSTSQPVHITVSETSPPPVVNIVARDPFASEGRHFWRDYPEATSWDADYWNTWSVNIGGTNTATFIVRRDTASSAALTVNYEISGTASNGVDYRTLPGSVQVPAGGRSARIVLMPIDDLLTEGIETVVLKLSASPDYSIGVPSQAAAVIIDNDRPRPPCVMLRDRHFHLYCPATNGLCFRLESSSDLRGWTPLCTNIVTDGGLHFVDPDLATNARFYRAVPDSGVLSDD